MAIWTPVVASFDGLRMRTREFARGDSLPVPVVSLFVDCASEAEIDRVYAALADGGSAPMPLGAYGFSRKFGWINDRFGVSWQVNLA